MSTADPFVTVRKLRELLADPRLLDDDEIFARTVAHTGNLGLVRRGQTVGRIEINPADGGATRWVFVNLDGQELEAPPAVEHLPKHLELPPGER